MFQLVYVGLTNLCQHSTTHLTRGIMTNEHKQSALSKARSFKHSKTRSSFLYSIYHQRTLISTAVEMISRVFNNYRSIQIGFLCFQ